MNDNNNNADSEKSTSGDLGVNNNADSEKSPSGVNMFYGASQILFDFAKQLRCKPTEAEDFLWVHLSNKKIQNVRFKLQHPILYFIADFYCHKAKLIIEVDGGYHQLPAQHEYDCNRDFELEELGLKVLRFTNEQVLLDIENTLRKIEDEVKQRTTLKFLKGNYG
ncbi:MAG TPA: endonuclease domain-containing protein, partial [Prolixibacteraceae bacterium]|nr:endonuclease domain-containing protein [Prolixibacteraceae bacterium]